MTELEKFIENIPLAGGCSIVAWHPCGLVAINKRAGRMTHPNQNDALKGRVSMLRANYNFKGEYYSWDVIPPDEDESVVSFEPEKKNRLYLVNRLDSPTSGIVVASSNAEVAALAKEEFRQRRVEKVYYAICIGRPFQKSGVFSDRLKKMSGRGFVRSAVSGSGMTAKTEYCVEENDANNAGLSLIKLVPKTGYTHQLRVQCAQRRFPILGDASYGNFQANKMFKRLTNIDRLFLHCKSTSLQIELNGKKIEFTAEAPVPSSFDALIKYNSSIAKNFGARI